jgi:hypothetical protein
MKADDAAAAVRRKVLLETASDGDGASLRRLLRGLRDLVGADREEFMVVRRKVGELTSIL